jgi:hypothetical protein
MSRIQYTPSQIYSQSNEAAPSGDALDLDRDEVTQVVRRMLGRETLSLMEWSAHPLSYAVRSATSAGIWRIQGTATPTGPEPGEQTLTRSLILKVTQPSGVGSDDIGHWNYWRREASAYESGLLERLAAEDGADPSGLAVPRCWNVEQRPDGRLWLWLEDVAEDNGGPWSLERYGLAARHFGAFQGGFLQGRDLPSDAWLSRGWMRARVASFSDAMRRLHDPAIWEQPLVLRTCPRSLEGRLARLWDERGRLLDALDRLPQTVCHFDVWRPNLLSRSGPLGEQTVVLDWSYVGIGAVGQDIGNLVPDSAGNFDIGVDQAKAMDQAVFAGYLQGLRAQGWTGDARQVRLGYAASAALGWGLGTPWWLVWPEDKERQEQIERRWGRPLEELLVQRAALTEFVLDLADEAFELSA